MKLITKSNDFSYLIIPTTLYKETKEKTILEIKKILINYNKRYQLLNPGYYEVNVYYHKFIGTILSIEKIDSFEFSLETDLKIVLKDKIKVFLKLLNPLDFPNYKEEIDIEDLTYKEFLNLIEHATLNIKNDN